MKKRFGFHIVKGKEEATEGNVEDITEEFDEYQDSLQEMELKIQRHKRRFFRRLVLVTAVLVITIVAGGLFFQYRTYSKASVNILYKNKEVDSSNYAEYAGGVLKYSRDGVAYLSQEGKEIWNQPCQMQNPSIEICKSTVAVGDIGGSSIIVFQKDGLKGEIQTTSPIQKFTVSEQGIVGVILKKESAQQILCYDAKGNILVEQSASLINTGYPIDLALSNTGEVLLVSYIYTKGNTTVSNVAYYDFGKGGEAKTDHLSAETEYEDSVIPAVAFIDEKNSVLIGDHVLVFNRGLDKPQEVKKIELKKEIKSVAYDQSGVALVLKNSGKKGYELRVYNADGKQIVSETFEGEYGNIKMTDGRVIMFDGKECSIFTRSGVHKFSGKIEANIMEIFPVFGLNKYMVINADGFYEIRLVK